MFTHVRIWEFNMNSNGSASSSYIPPLVNGDIDRGKDCFFIHDGKGQH